MGTHCGRPTVRLMSCSTRCEIASVASACPAASLNGSSGEERTRGGNGVASRERLVDTEADRRAAALVP
jgi:hypothetical protein